MRLFLMLTLSIFLTMPLTAASNPSTDPNTPEHSDPKIILTTLDTNKDGQLNYQETMANQEIADRFLQLDIDKNGFLNLSELDEPKKMTANQIKILLTFASLQCI